MERINLTEIRNRVSWGSIIGGVVTVIAISILLSILATSIGLFMLDPQSDDPMSGIGTTVGIWTVVSMLISLFVGGFVAGKLAGRDGAIHGFLVWSTSMFITVIMVAMLAIGAVKLTANILGSVSSVAGNVISGMGSAVGNGISELSDDAQQLFGDIDFNTDNNGESIQQNVKEALRKSGVKELQPEYLQRQMNAVKKDFGKSVKKVVANPENADKIMDGFTDRLKKRADKFTNNVSRDDVARAIANNTDMTKAEAERAIDQYTDMLNKAIDQAKEEINKLEQAIENAKQEWAQMKQKALEEADKASNAAARSALYSFIGMLVGAIVCCIAGSYGTRKTREGYEV